MLSFSVGSKTLTVIGVPGEHPVRWYWRGNITRQGLVIRIRSFSFKAVPPFVSFLLTAVMDQGLGGELLNAEIRQGSFPLHKKREKIKSVQQIHLSLSYVSNEYSLLA